MNATNSVTFAALAEPTRLRIIDMLAQRGALSASDISAMFSSSAPAISQHLRVLREAGLVTVHKRAQQRIYYLEPSSMTEVQEWIESRLAKWNARLDSMESYINQMEKEDNHDK